MSARLHTWGVWSSVCKGWGGGRQRLGEALKNGTGLGDKDLLVKMKGRKWGLHCEKPLILVQCGKVF